MVNEHSLIELKFSIHSFRLILCFRTIHFKNFKRISLLLRLTANDRDLHPSSLHLHILGDSEAFDSMEGFSVEIDLVRATHLARVLRCPEFNVSIRVEQRATENF